MKISPPSTSTPGFAPTPVSACKFLCLNGVPFALSWQTARKSDRDVQLLNQESYNFLKYAWEKHRNIPKGNTDFVADHSLDVPVSGSNDTPYPIDQSSHLGRLALSTHGVALWMEDIKDKGGLASVTNPEVIRACIEGVEFDIHMHQRSIKSTEQYLETHKDSKAAASIKKTVSEFKDRIALLTDKLLKPLQARQAELKTDSSAS